MRSAKNLTIFQMNDSHAYIEPHTEYFVQGGNLVLREAGGYARIAGLVSNAMEKERINALFFDNGDTIHGTYAAVQSRGKDMVPILNAMPIDGMTMHWEFAYGPDQLYDLAKGLDFPLIACNVYEEDSDQLSYPPFRIFERGNLQIGVIGIANRIVDITMPEKFSKGVRITTGFDELPSHIDTLRNYERVDLVVVLSHLGFPHANHIAENIEGIDVFLSGHTHNRRRRPTKINNTFLIQSGYQGSFIGRLDLEIEDRRIRTVRHQLIEINDSIEEDEEVKEKVESTISPHRDMLEEVVGETETPLARFGVLESTMDNFLLQGLIHSSGAEIAFSNGWRYGAPVRKGLIKMEDLWNTIPVNPPVSICKITGEEILEMMEENLEATFSRDPFGQMGGYVKRCMGLNIYFKIENPEGRRIEEFYVGGQKLDRDKKYRACYVTAQGIPEKYGRGHENLGVSAVDALAEYLATAGSIKSELKGTIVAI